GPPAISPEEDIAPRTSPFPPLTREQGRDIGRFIGSMIAGAKAPSLVGAAGRRAGAVVGRGASQRALPPAPKVGVDVAPPETPIRVAGAPVGATTPTLDPMLARAASP